MSLTGVGGVSRNADGYPCVPVHESLYRLCDDSRVCFQNEHFENYHLILGFTYSKQTYFYLYFFYFTIWSLTKSLQRKYRNFTQ